MPAGRNVWREVSEKLSEKAMHIKVWLGDPVHDEYAKKNYKDCLVLDFYRLNKVVGINQLDFKINTDIFKNKEFYVLKDQVYKMMDRQDDLGIYGRLEREALFYSLFFYFYTLILEKEIELLIASEGPHSPASMVLYGVCRILNIKTYHLAQNAIAPIAHICTDFYGGKIKIEHEFDFSQQHKIMSNYVRSISDATYNPLYMQLQSGFDEKTKSLAYRLNVNVIKPIKNFFYREPENSYNLFKMDFYNKNYRPFLYQKKINERKRNLFFEHNSALKEFDLANDFVYLPLHYEPERTSNPDGGEFYNVYDMILWLRGFLPSHISIVVKEHPSQFTGKMYGYRGRSPLFYKTISTLSNVYLVDTKIKSSELINRSLFVATQTGSAALEAALMHKKSLVFGAAWFLDIPNVHTYKEVDCFESFCSMKIDNKREVEKSLNSYIDEYAIPACVNPSGEKYFRTKFGKLFSDLVDDSIFSKVFTDTIYKDYMSNRDVQR